MNSTNKFGAGSKLIGKNIRVLRRLHNLSQEDVASVLHIARQHYCMLENHRRCIDIYSLCSLADRYGVSVDDLMTKDFSAIAINSLKNE